MTLSSSVCFRFSSHLITLTLHQWQLLNQHWTDLVMNNDNIVGSRAAIAELK